MTRKWLIPSAYNGEVLAFPNVRTAAQTLLTGKQPELLFLDINIPKVPGLHMLEFIQRRQAWKELPVIVLSSEAANGVVDRVLQMNADADLKKPVTIEGLEKTMANAIEKHVSIK